MSDQILPIAEMTISEWANILMEIMEQPTWRRDADKCCDYYDGNQLDSDTLAVMRDLGLAPIIENVIAPTIDSVLGLEAKTRLDWRVTANADDKYKDVAEALNQRINEAEHEAHADRACGDAYASQIKAGLGWVGVEREHDPFRYPYRVEAVHRNEIFYDWKARDPGLLDARYIVRQRWHDIDQLKSVFPAQADVIDNAGSGWATTDPALMMDGGQSTGLARNLINERAWTIQEQEWREIYRRRLCLSEVWYRRWVKGSILRTPDGRVIEFNPANPVHNSVVTAGIIQPQEATYSKVRLAWWIGPHKLADIANPYSHGKIPYIPFWGKREDMTGVPYGLTRTMIPMQDEINARNTKMIWLLTAKRITMTEGVTDVEEARDEAARPDAVHILDANAMRAGGLFRVESDFSLNSQQYQALQDKRAALKNVAGIYKSFEGQNSSAVSGLAINSLVEQSTQGLAEINENYRYARAQVGDLLLSLLIEDIGDQETVVTVKRNTLEKMSITLNQQSQGVINNDVQRARLKVALSDVPNTFSYRQQQLSLMTEITKSLPPQLQAQLLDFVILATDMPEKDAIVERIRKAIGLGNDPEKQQMQQQIQALTQAVQAAQNDPKLRELDAKIALLQAQTLAQRANVYKIAQDLETAERQEAAAGIPKNDPVEREVGQWFGLPPGAP